MNKNCDSCYSCNSCEFCEFCNFCKDLVNGFMCMNLKLKKKDKTKYWIFNKKVTKKQWDNRWNIGKEYLK